MVQTVELASMGRVTVKKNNFAIFGTGLQKGKNLIAT